MLSSDNFKFRVLRIVPDLVFITHSEIGLRPIVPKPSVLFLPKAAILHSSSKAPSADDQNVDYMA